MMPETHELQEKYINDSEFQTEIDVGFERYQQLVQEAYYANLADINEDLLIRLDSSQE